MVQLITNSETKNGHLGLLEKLGKKADAIFFAVAFFRQSGFDMLSPMLKGAIQRKVPVKAICGLNFGLSEPQALMKLVKLLNNGVDCGAFFPKDEKKTFHPKIYCFKIGEELHVVTGSANVTEGGLTENTEASLYWAASLNDPNARDILKYFDFLFSEDFAEPATLLRISQYKPFFQDQETKRRKHSRQSQQKTGKKPRVNYDIFSGFYDDFLKEKDARKVNKQRRSNYLEAKEVLTELTSVGLTKAEFTHLYERLVGVHGEDRLWHPDSLYRKKADVIRHYKGFVKLVKFVRDNIDDNATKLFAKGKELIADIPGVGPNILTEIMLTYKPEKFASLNKNPITVLTKANCGVKKSPATYTGEDYQEFCDLFEEIRQKLDLPTNLEVDSFLNHTYWKIKNQA